MHKLKIQIIIEYYILVKDKSPAQLIQILTVGRHLNVFISSITSEVTYCYRGETMLKCLPTDRWVTPGRQTNNEFIVNVK